MKEVEVVSAPADTVDTKVTWTVEVFTHVPQSQAQNIGLQLTVLSLDGKTEVFNLAKPTKKPEAYERAKTSLQGRKDTFAVKLPQGFEPAAVLVYDRWVGGEPMPGKQCTAFAIKQHDSTATHQPVALIIKPSRLSQ